MNKAIIQDSVRAPVTVKVGLNIMRPSISLSLVLLTSKGTVIMGSLLEFLNAEALKAIFEVVDCGDKPDKNIRTSITRLERYEKTQVKVLSKGDWLKVSEVITLQSVFNIVSKEIAPTSRNQGTCFQHKGFLLAWLTVENPSLTEANAVCSSLTKEFGPSPNSPKNRPLEKEMGKDHIVEDDGANLVDSLNEQDNLHEGDPRSATSTSIAPLTLGKGVELGPLAVRADANFFVNLVTLKMIYSIEVIASPLTEMERITTRVEYRNPDVIFLGTGGKRKYVDSSRGKEKKICVREELVVVTAKIISVILFNSEPSKTFGTI
ncbi:hypothetical protein V6N11_071250 [Hibiscus sabdariffa]|uniref:Uncharacterized protein n=1 Tax=Hibiscus sabdariffa TaxID=183260 RepID=A0ABR2TZH8_9ROSI